jgi:excisionase family DNA binding protein
MPGNDVVPTELSVISAKQLAVLLGMSTRTVRRLVSAGRLPAPVRIGRSVRWRSADTSEWLAAGCGRTKERAA